MARTEETWAKTIGKLARLAWNVGFIDIKDLLITPQDQEEIDLECLGTGISYRAATTDEERARGKTYDQLMEEPGAWFFVDEDWDMENGRFVEGEPVHIQRWVNPVTGSDINLHVLKPEQLHGPAENGPPGPIETHQVGA